jgi:hypothetical protein
MLRRNLSMSASATCCSFSTSLSEPPSASSGRDSSFSGTSAGSCAIRPSAETPRSSTAMCDSSLPVGAVPRASTMRALCL